MEDCLFDENDIENKEYYKEVQSFVKCPICSNIFKDPVQCSKCQHCFCSECVKNLSICIYGCENIAYTPALLCKELLSKIAIKCTCGAIYQYNYFRKHKEEECQYANFKKNYFNLRKKYELIKQELNKKKDDDYKIKNSYYILCSLHPHRIEAIRRFINSWYCDCCHKPFKETIPSYHCSLCDFDVCYNCVKDKIIKGTIKEAMKNFY